MSINQHIKVLVPDNLVIVCLICGIWNNIIGMHIGLLLVLINCLVNHLRLGMGSDMNKHHAPLGYSWAQSSPYIYI